jgi:hypothetical protein
MPDVTLGPDFNGPDYEPEHDHARLTGQIKRVFDLMSDGTWRTLAEIEACTGDPPASISAQLRHLRKKRFGSFIVLKRPRGERVHGLWEYQLQPPVTPEASLFEEDQMERSLQP